MKQRILSRALLLIGTLTLVLGTVVHGISRDSRDAEDRQQMMRGTAIGVSGIVLVTVGLLLRKAAREH